MTEPKGKVCHYSEVDAEVFGDEAPGVTIRWVSDEERDGAPIYALRVIEVASVGHTPDHTHPFEHEILSSREKGGCRLMANGLRWGRATLYLFPLAVNTPMSTLVTSHSSSFVVSPYLN